MPALSKAKKAARERAAKRRAQQQQQQPVQPTVRWTIDFEVAPAVAPKPPPPSDTESEGSAAPSVGSHYLYSSDEEWFRHDSSEDEGGERPSESEEEEAPRAKRMRKTPHLPDGNFGSFHRPRLLRTTESFAGPDPKRCVQMYGRERALEFFKSQNSGSPFITTLVLGKTDEKHTHPTRMLVASFGVKGEFVKVSTQEVDRAAFPETAETAKGLALFNEKLDMLIKDYNRGEYVEDAEFESSYTPVGDEDALREDDIGSFHTHMLRMARDRMETGRKTHIMTRSMVSLIANTLDLMADGTIPAKQNAIVKRRSADEEYVEVSRYPNGFTVVRANSPAFYKKHKCDIVLTVIGWHVSSWCDGGSTMPLKAAQLIWCRAAELLKRDTSSVFVCGWNNYTLCNEVVSESPAPDGMSPLADFPPLYPTPMFESLNAAPKRLTLSTLERPDKKIKF